MFGKAHGDEVVYEDRLIVIEGLVGEPHIEGGKGLKAMLHEADGIEQAAQVDGLAGDFGCRAFLLQIDEQAADCLAASVFKEGNSFNRSFSRFSPEIAGRRSTAKREVRASLSSRVPA